jgi:PAS domain S-box-containing protein
MSIRLKLVILFLAIALTPTLLISLLSFYNSRDAIEAVHLSSLRDLTVFRADKIETYFAGLKTEIEMAQGFYNIKKNLPVLTRLAGDPANPEMTAAKKMLGEQLQQMQSVSGLSDIMLVNSEGKVVYANKPGHYSKNLATGFDTEQKAFREGKDKICFSDVYFDKAEDNRFEILVTAPVSDFNDAFIGVIAFEVDMTSVYKLIQDTTGLGKTGEMLIGKKIGNEVEFLTPLRYDPQAALKRKVTFGETSAFPIQQAVQGKIGSGRAIDYRGKQVIAAWRYIPSLDWGVVAKIDIDEAFADVANLQKLVTIVLVLIFILSAITAFSISRSIAEPIKRLSQGAAIIGSGNLDYKVGTLLKDEIGQLSRSFDKMTHDLKQTTASRDELNREVAERKQAEKALRESREDLNRAQAVAHVGSWRMNVQRNELTWSGENHRIFGIPAGTPMTYETFLGTIHPDDRDFVDKKWAAALTGEKYDIEHRIIVDGKIKWVRERAELEFDKTGVLLGGFGTTQDITSRKEMEEEIRRSVKQFELLSETAGQLLQSKNPQQIINMLCHKVMEHLDCHIFVNYLVDESIHRLHLNACAGMPEKMVKDIEWLDFGQAICGRVAQEGKRIVAESIQESCDSRADLVRSVGIKAYACHPLLSQNGVIGTLSFGTRSRTTFSEEDLAMMKTVADQVATAMERMRFEEALRKSRDELEIRVRERTQELAQTVDILQGEIQERIHAEKEAKTERKRFEDVLEMLPAYAVLLTPDYHVAYANRTFREWFGDDNGKKCYEFLFNRTEPCEDCQTYAVLKTQKSQFWEWTGPNGKNYDIYDYPFTDSDGSPLIMEIGVDVTAHKQAQTALRSTSLYARGLIEASLDPLVTISPEGKITDVNEATEAVTGLLRERLIGSDFSNYFTDPQKANEGYKKVIAEGKVIDYPLTIRHRDGRLTDVLYNATVYKDTHGNVLGVFAAARDVTERKAAQEKQGVTNSLLKLFARKTLRKTYLDSTVKIIRNWSGCEFVGVRIRDNERNIPYESHVDFDKDFLALENDLNLDHDNCVCIRAILQRDVQQQERNFISAGGSFYCNDSQAFLNSLTDQQKKEYRGNCIKHGFQSISVVPIRYRDEILGAIHIADFKKDMVLLPKVQFIETTIAPLIGEAVHRFNAESELEKHRLHLEDMVKQRTDDLARSNKDLEQFAYVASHDLQEPLRAISGFVELLKRNLQNSLDARTTEYMDFTVEGAKRMQSLINGLLEYSRISARGRKPEQTDSKAALDRAIAYLLTSIKESGAKITVESLPPIHIDPVQLTQLFQNLIGNAIKFRSKERPLEIHISAVRQTNVWQFAVTDNGIGIEPQYTERIFLIFQRLHTRQQYPGTGIGLAICKKIIERHGGKIWVESKPGNGSTFYFTVPDIGEN